jgi:hypothetical protein
MSLKMFLFLIVLLSIFIINTLSISAQNHTSKVDAGFVFTAIRQPDDFFQIVPRNEFPSRIRHNLGYGGRVTYNLTKNIGVEAEVTYFPKERFLGIAGPFSTVTGFDVGGKRTEGLFGIKAGKRLEKFGVFGKIRPGFMRFDQIPDCKNSTSRCTSGSKSEFALDVGGVIEYYPSSHSFVRFDVGDTIIRYGKINTLPGFIPSQVGGGTTNNAQYSVGVGFRF